MPALSPYLTALALTGLLMAAAGLAILLGLRWGRRGVLLAVALAWLAYVIFFGPGEW